jgi:hypothetical protein
MKPNRNFLLLAATFFALFSSVEVAAQAPAPVTLVKAGRLLDPRTGNVLSPAAVLIEDGKVKKVGSLAQVHAAICVVLLLWPNCHLFKLIHSVILRGFPRFERAEHRMMP